MSVVEETRLIELTHVSKTYDTTEALIDVNLYIRKKEFITLLGPSGCGKTTTLRLIGGFETPTEGRIIFEGADITQLPPYKRRVNTVFQRYALFPHLNVFENIAFGLRIKKLDSSSIKTRVGRMLDMVGLSGFAKRSVDNLSGGQQQRVAIARALANDPEVLLLDEPLGALDLKLRKEMQLELKNIQQHSGITFVYVTHDQEEALTMSDIIAVMRDGRLQQVGTPIDIYNEPKNAFIADFIGESNILPGIMLRDELVRFDNNDFICVDKGFGEDAEVEAVVRPEDVRIGLRGEGPLHGVVTSIVFKGVHYEIMVRTDSFHWMVHSTRGVEQGAEVSLDVVPFDIHIMAKGADT